MSSSSSSSESVTFVATAPRPVVQDDGIAIIDKKSSTCEAEKVLVDNCNKLSCLFTLCIGLESTAEDGTSKPLLNLDDPAFKNLKKKELKPTLDFLKEEINRRYLLEGLPTILDGTPPHGRR
jgi:hypothetical protein